MTESQQNDPGQREVYTSGGSRDTAVGKARYDLIPPGPLYRIAETYRRGAERYGEHNWELGMPTSRMMASLIRHIESYRRGDTSEDHLGHAAFNIIGLMFFEGTEWDDHHEWPSTAE
jgi:hypothetical protein